MSVDIFQRELSLTNPTEPVQCDAVVVSLRGSNGKVFAQCSEQISSPCKVFVLWVRNHEFALHECNLRCRHLGIRSKESLVLIILKVEVPSAVWPISSTFSPICPSLWKVSTAKLALSSRSAELNSVTVACKFKVTDSQSASPLQKVVAMFPML